VGAPCPVSCRYTEAKLARFYRLALPDADSVEGVTSAPQTLTTELALLSDELVHHVGHMISPVMNIAYLSVVLRRSLGSAPLLVYLGYFCIATALIEKVKKGSAKACGGTLAAAISEGQQLESELRERCSKVHNNREEIAMLRGESLSLSLSLSIYIYTPRGEYLLAREAGRGFPFHTLARFRSANRSPSKHHQLRERTNDEEEVEEEAVCALG
jgi:hypothetical protein